jgi:hypothetical protein
VAHNFVTDPAYLGPQALPLAVRKKILDKLRLPEFYSVPLRSLYGDGDHPELWTRFCAFTRELDALRGERFAAVFPELCALIGP